MNVRVVDDMQEPLRWFKEGLRLFKLNPMLWLMGTLGWGMIAITLLLIPLIGKLAVWLTLPAIYAGFFLWATNLDTGKPIAIPQLFHGLTDPQMRSRFLTVGLFTFMVLFIMSAVSSPPAAMPTGGSEGVTTTVAVNSILREIIVLMVSLLMSLAVIYAAPIIMYSKADAIEAVMTSFEACSKNWKAFVIFAGVYLVLIGVLFPIHQYAAIIAWLAIWPISVGAAYTSYKSINADATSGGALAT
jgi:hypothetical protein